MAMNQVTAVLKRFFEDFERSSNTFESDLIAAQFSDLFMAADPSGNTQVITKDEFIAGWQSAQPQAKYLRLRNLCKVSIRRLHVQMFGALL
jgi:hypothetical protein